MTQRRVRQIMDVWYGDGPLGYCGDEDYGEMASWYVLSAMGFYTERPDARSTTSDARSSKNRQSTSAAVKPLRCPHCGGVIEIFDETMKKGFCLFCDKLIEEV